MAEDAVAMRHALVKRVAVEAGARALGHWRRRDGLAIEVKANPQDIVSIADRDVEEAIRAAVAAAFPDDGFLGEEGGAAEGASGFTWVIDPIDGTAPFLFGMPCWCVSIAVWQGSRTVAGAIAVPATGELFAARAGQGAELDGAVLRVPPGLGLRDAQTGIGASHRTDPDRTAAIIGRLMREGGMYFRNGSGALMLAYVAAGRLAGYFEPHMHAWDCLAGLLIIEEAGGRVGPFPEAGDLGRGGRVIAAAPAAWDDLVAVAAGA